MDIVTILKALSNQKRLALLAWLREPGKHFYHHQGGMDGHEVCVGLIEQKLGLSQSTTSKYLAQLQQAGLVTARRQGQWTYYRYNCEAIDAFMKALGKQL